MQEILCDAEIEFCMRLQKYQEKLEASYHIINSLNDLFSTIKELEILENVNLKRMDTIIHNKLISSLKEFKTADIDPLMFLDEDSGNYYMTNFYGRYILSYFEHLINQMYLIISKIIDRIEELDNLLERHEKFHKIKILRALLSNKNIVLSEKKLKVKIDEIKELYKQYNDLCDDFYRFDIKDDYLKIAEYNVQQIDYHAREDGVRNSALYLTIQYGIDKDYLKHMHKEDLLPELEAIYFRKFYDNAIDPSIMKDIDEKYFTSCIPESIDNCLGDTKLNSDGLRTRIRDILMRKANIKQLKKRQ